MEVTQARYFGVQGMTKEQRRKHQPAPKTDEVVRAHNFFLAKRDEADFASDYTTDTL
jgi:hypothetical protein